MDASLIIYTGVALANIPIAPNTNLQTILAAIDTAIVNNTTAPDFTPWNLYCVTQIDGSSQPTNIENFSKGISKILCDHIDDYDTFVGTTYVNDQTVVGNAISALQVPGLTYAPFGIVNTDTSNQMWTKSFTGFTSLRTDLDPSSANWAAISVSPDPTTIPDAFDAVITVYQTLISDMAGKQDDLGTFDTTSVGGTTGRDGEEAIDDLIAYVAALPTFTAGSVTWLGVTSASDLQDTIQNIINSVSYLLTNGVVDASTGLVESAVGSTYQGKKLAIDTTWSGLYKVAIDSGDIATADYLENKITSLDGSITIDTTTNPDKLDISVTTPNDNLVKVNVSDSNAGYLAAKIATTTDNIWGITLSPSATTDNSQVAINASIDPNILIPQIFAYVSSSPSLLALFCSLQTQCAGCLCAVIDDLIVSLDLVNTEFDLSWTPTGGTTTSQVAKYRANDATTWLTGNFNPPNVLADTDAATTAENLNTNTVYQFQVDSNCPGDASNSNIFEAIIYEEQAVSYDIVAGVVSVSQDPLAYVDTVEYQLIDINTSLAVDSFSAPGTAPIGSFASQVAGTYRIDWRYGTLVNGVTLWSTDASQENAWYDQAGVVIP